MGQMFTTFSIYSRFVYLSENYNILGDPKLTHQKANAVVKKFIEENSNNINLLKIKLEETLKQFTTSIRCYTLKFIIE